MCLHCHHLVERLHPVFRQCTDYTQDPETHDQFLASLAKLDPRMIRLHKTTIKLDLISNQIGTPQA